MFKTCLRLFFQGNYNNDSGIFSERLLEEINECTYDPPYVGKGSNPGWAAGSGKTVNQVTDGIPTYTASEYGDESYDDDYAYDYRRRRDVGNRKRRYDMNSYGGGE